MGNLKKDAKTTMSKIPELKAINEKKQSKLFKDIKLFWAFSNEQFNEGLKKYGIDKNIKLVHIGNGGYLPKDNYNLFIDGMDKLDKDYKKSVKDYKNDCIIYELNNYECFYTGDIREVIKVLKGIATPNQILKQFNILKGNL